MKLRKTDVHEIDRVMEIPLDGKASLAALGIDQWQGEGYPARDIVEEDVREGVSYVIEDDRGHLAATCMISFSGEEDYDEIEGEWLTEGDSSNPAYAVVHRVAVAADSVGKGAARLMLGNAQNLAHEGGAQSLRVDTHPGNVPMLSLLRSSGFTECGIIRIKHAGGLTPERVAFEKLL